MYSYPLEGNCIVGKEDVEMGLMWDDGMCSRRILSFTSFDLYIAGIVTPSPACKRALQEVISALGADGQELLICVLACSS